MKKGFADINALIGVIVFVLVVFMVALPTINSSLFTNSAAIASFGTTTPALLITFPLLILVGVIATIAIGLMR